MLVVVVAAIVCFLLLAKHSSTAPLFGTVVALTASILPDEPEERQRGLTALLLVVLTLL